MKLSVGFIQALLREVEIPVKETPGDRLSWTRYHSEWIPSKDSNFMRFVASSILHPYSCSRMVKAHWLGWCLGGSLVLAQSCLASTRTYPTTEIGSMRLWVDERRNSKQDSFWRYGCDSRGGASDSCLEGNNEWISIFDQFVGVIPDWIFEITSEYRNSQPDRWRNTRSSVSAV